MRPKKEFLNLQIEIDKIVIMEFKGVITQTSIVDLARTVEATLVAYQEDEGKIRTIFEIIVEVMQNILSYAYDSIDMGNNTYQSNGQLKIALDKQVGIYHIHSGNLIASESKEVIQSLIDEANALDAEGLKELYKERRRSRRTSHNRGAGLGFLDMARKSKNKLEIAFSPNDEHSLLFELGITI